MDITAPRFPESVSEGTLSRWHFKEGAAVRKAQKVADIETDKIVLEVTAETDGVLGPHTVKEGATVKSQQVIGSIAPGAVAAPEKPKAEAEAKPAAKAAVKSETPAESGRSQQPRHAGAKGAVPPSAQFAPLPPIHDELPPSVRRLVAEHNLDISTIQGSGRNGQVTKADILRFIEHSPNVAIKFGEAAPSASIEMDTPAPAVIAPPTAKPEQRVKMTRLRARIAERLVDAQRNAAILTTFNEVNMQPVMSLRDRYKEKFEKIHGAKLGFMSFFVKAAVEALTRYPIVNASVDGNEIVYHGYYNIGMAVSSPRGLVVPVMNDADQLSFAGIEKKILDFGKRAQDGKLDIEELQGGTFTISNGGVFGSMLSTPILNPPQSGILGLHRIQERPVAENGQVVIRPMMYLALSYDHRIIDGREAVLFLVAVKDAIEDPTRLLLNI